MDLLSRLKDTESPRPEAFEQARMALRSRMADSGPGLAPAPAPALVGARHRSRRLPPVSRRTFGLGLGISVAAAAVAVTLVVTSTPQPASNTSRPLASSGSPSASAKAKPSARPSSAPLTVNAKLTSVVDYIKAHAESLPGDASLVLSKQYNDSTVPDNVGYNLYTDSGDYYWSPTASGLPEVIAQHDNIAGGVDAREKAAALYAVSGDLATAREKMVNASPNPFGLGLSPAGKKALQKKLAAQYAAMRNNPAYVKSRRAGGKFVGIPTGKALQSGIDNYLWNNSVDALTQAGGNPQIRAGVLRLLSTVSAVSVGNSTIKGTPTLTLTAGPEVFGGIPGDQVLTIYAKTGIPISSVSGLPGQAPSSVVTFQVSRVTVADIEAGKF